MSTGRKTRGADRKSAEMPDFDEIDRKILEILQRDSDLAVNALADIVGLSPTPCWRRIKRLEEAGVIKGRVAIVDHARANVGMTVFIGITAPRHETAWLNQFRALIDDLPEIVEAYRLTGATDYILKVVVPDISTYDRVYKAMIERLDFSQINSSISMEELKFTTAVPSTYL
ncbi:Lrp/AsnC family transcriptional regulator [Rhodovulum sulfidophilum]|uniref:Lrp/AsnC family transcriptional regulator n=1 Tax=Rhodovulum sulfidophilum TaxID=35806 RepID=UPI000AAF54F8|nr:Lrp/AsnC family transcriptional regulator [Rhodovulum sulfidophilum]MCW2304910.1 Lrp/AsnC family transcriptional regulator [Rhodovulum sulfidophilum]